MSYWGRLFYGKWSENHKKAAMACVQNLMKRNKYMSWLCYEKNRDCMYDFGICFVILWQN